MNLNALSEILTNQVEILEESANDNGVDVETILGVARDAAANGYDQLTDKQKYRFDQTIRHLIEDVECDGYQGLYGEDDPICEAILDDDDLVECYQEDNFLCEDCRADAANDGYSRDKFMED